MRAPQADEIRHDDDWAPIVRELERYCRDVCDDPERSYFVKRSEAVDHLETTDRVDVDGRVTGHRVGTAMSKVPWTELWSREVYQIIPEKLGR